ncbi:hypothetical protein GGX14DRAFT_544445 [Mycena pura]|uniref:Uncharacterized protein n=1 Tax=Mycena pura TaxID=153505 RepID=A0AAD6Y5S9_9AGAR|nr:hypothetical protein GGX14DRAFT_544445 [Mycena pura]
MISLGNNTVIMLGRAPHSESCPGGRGRQYCGVMYIGSTYASLRFPLQHPHPLRGPRTVAISQRLWYNGTLQIFLAHKFKICFPKECVFHALQARGRADCRHVTLCVHLHALALALPHHCPVPLFPGVLAGGHAGGSRAITVAGHMQSMHTSRWVRCGTARVGKAVACTTGAAAVLHVPPDPACKCTEPEGCGVWEILETLPVATASTSELAQATTNCDPLSWLESLMMYLHILASGVGKLTEAGNKKIDETEGTGSDSKAAASLARAPVIGFLVAVLGGKELHGWGLLRLCTTSLPKGAAEEIRVLADHDGITGLAAPIIKP